MIRSLLIVLVAVIAVTPATIGFVLRVIVAGFSGGYDAGGRFYDWLRR